MINHNGIVLPASKVALHPENRGLHYGDAVFETIKVSTGKVLFWEDHYFRLMAAMRVMRMEIPMSFTLEFLEEEIKKTIESASEKAIAYRIKLLVWRSWGGKYTPLAKTVEYVIFAEFLDEPFYTLNEASYEVELFKDHYINSGLLSTLKTNNRAINILAGIYSEENEYQNCLLLNENKQVIEASNGNLFLVNRNKIKTPPLTDGCLNGIIRKQIIAILKQLPEYTLEEISISPFELQKADELFVTNTIVGIQAVSKFRKKLYTNTVAKDLLAKLNIKARLD
jgi:branched-chain amino acid aminotransferase